jgi:hypothetical protein
MQTVSLASPSFSAPQAMSQSVGPACMKTQAEPRGKPNFRTQSRSERQRLHADPLLTLQKGASPVVIKHLPSGMFGHVLAAELFV